MTIEEILKLRKGIDEALETLGDAMVNAQNALDQLSDSIAAVDNADRNLSEEEFAQWTAIGFRVGARFRIDGLDDPLPMTVTGISTVTSLWKCTRATYSPTFLMSRMVIILRSTSWPSFCSSAATVAVFTLP